MITTELFTREGSKFTGRATTNDRGHVGYFPGWRTCSRCGGAGGADKWKFTGWTCFDCDGKGKLPSDRFIKLYDADKLAKLDARAAKLEAARVAKRQAAAEAEATRIAAERETIINDHRAILDRIANVVDITGDGFLADMHRQVSERARPLSERQIETANTACERIEAETARKASASYVGNIGDRVELTVSFVRKYDITEGYFGAPARFIWTFRDENGNTITYIGGYAKALDGITDGAIKIVATVKDHKEYRGEPQTVIQRPKAV